MTPNKIGEIAEAKILTKLLEKACEVVLPHSHASRYDMAIVKGRELDRIQVKNGRFRGGRIAFATRSLTRGYLKGYEGVCEYFGVYCPDLRKCYLVPAKDVPDNGWGYLRITPPGNNQKSGITWASDYEI